MTCKAIILDYIGTLVEPHDYSLEASRVKLHAALHEAGLETNINRFMKAYKTAHEKYRKTRYEKLTEVTNAVWVSEALSNAGCKATVNDPRLKTALNVFFQDFIDSLELRAHAKKLIKNASEYFKVGLISNFTYAPVIYASLRKLGIDSFFSAIVVSDSLGWRKPHRIIFDEALRMLKVKPEEAVFIGDSPIEDVGGAKAVGMQTVFVASCFNTLTELEKCGVKPDLIIEDLKEICDKLPEIVQSLGCSG